ncbi:MAG TPA: ferredoxin [Candidatus Nanoarchaeia archaeon]|nr:ferredoxin [Candidatus Nanoarchaeia archaeon]
MKIEFNKEKCIGSGACAASAPSYFTLNYDEGKAVLAHSKSNGKEVFTADIVHGKEQEAIDAANSCPVNAIRVLKDGRDVVKVDVGTGGMREIKAQYDDLKEFKMDSKGYFLIRVNKEKRRVEAGHCKGKNEIDVMVYGDKAIDIYMTIIKLGLIVEMGHAAYLGREIEKACLALKNGLKYVQDDELELN